MWRRLRGRAGRSVALLLGILVATTGFVVLTGPPSNTRAAYHILVRPEGARTRALLLVAAGTAAGGILLSGLAALVPTALLRRLPIARLLAEE